VDRNSLKSESSASELRSRVMRSVLSRGNKSTELALGSVLHSMRIRKWKVHDKKILGTPDFIFSKQKVLIFVDGCFWHGCVRCYRRPKTSRVYWDKKLQDNKERDRRNSTKLKQEGWEVIRIWEHQLKAPLRVRRILEKVFAK
jgi:DNA mismatch endonuclease, patch repair protein